MTRTRIHTTSLSPVAARWLALTGTAMAATLFAGALSAVQAQGVYRIVGPDGKVTFSDRAPAAAAQPALRGGAASAVAPAGGQEASLSALPYDLRQTALRFPVTLYTSAECAPCASARSLLQARGVPFSERTVQSNEDIEALQRLSSSASLPGSLFKDLVPTGHFFFEFNSGISGNASFTCKQMYRMHACLGCKSERLVELIVFKQPQQQVKFYRWRCFSSS